MRPRARTPRPTPRQPASMAAPHPGAPVCPAAAFSRRAWPGGALAGAAFAWLLAASLLAAPLSAQHEHGASPYAHLAGGPGALLPEEVEQLRSGEGMGLALPAELNGFPGPKHVLELADGLGLTPEQHRRIEEIRRGMQERAVAKGEEIITVAGHLAEAFRAGRPAPEDVARMTAHIGALRGELQAIHLTAHLETRDALTDGQVAAYDRLRGYGAGG